MTVELRLPSRNRNPISLYWLSGIFLLIISATSFADSDKAKFFTKMPSDGTPIIFAKSNDADKVCAGQLFVDPATGLVGKGTKKGENSCIGTRAAPPTCTGAGQTDCYIANDTSEPLIAVKKDEVEKYVRFGVRIGGITGKILPMITPVWRFNDSDSNKPIFSEGKSKTDWMKMTGSSFCPTADGWMPATRSDFNLAATIGGFTNDANTPIFAAGQVYSDGAALAYSIDAASVINQLYSAAGAKKVCVAEIAGSSASGWTSAGSGNGYHFFKYAAPNTFYFAVDIQNAEEPAVPCSEITIPPDGWAGEAANLSWRAATIVDLQFAIATSGVGGEAPLAYDTSYLTADSKRYTFTANNVSVTEVTDSRTAGATICVKHLDAASIPGTGPGGT